MASVDFDMKSLEHTLLRVALVAFALSLFFPLVSFEVGEATSTSHVGSRGAKGVLFVGVYQSQFEEYPIGGSVTCNYPTENALVHVKDIYCDLAQITFPVFLFLLLLVIISEGFFFGKWLLILRWSLAAVVWSLSLGSLIVAQDKETYLNSGSITNEVISYGGVTMIVALVALLLAGLVNFKNNSTFDYSKFSGMLQDKFF